MYTTIILIGLIINAFLQERRISKLEEHDNNHVTMIGMCLEILGQKKIDASKKRIEKLVKENDARIKNNR